jgi:hypothetical protein
MPTKIYIPVEPILDRHYHSCLLTNLTRDGQNKLLGLCDRGLGPMNLDCRVLLDIIRVRLLNINPRAGLVLDLVDL